MEHRENTMPLIAAYNFEGGDSPAADLSGNGHELTINFAGVSPWVAGHNSTYAVQAKDGTQGTWGSAAYSAFPGGAPGSSPRTIMFWAQRVNNDEAVLISAYNENGRGDPFVIGAASDGSIQGWWYDSNNVGSVAPTNVTAGLMTANTWAHIAIVLEPGTGVTIYVNGSLATSYAWQNGTNATYDTWETLLVGASRWGSNQAIVDDIRIYDEALPGMQIATLMNTPVGEETGTSVNLLNLGDTAIGKLYLGNTEATKAYLGTTLVYGQGEDGENSTSQGTLYITPPNGNFTTGDTIQFQVRVNSGETDINTVQANLSYPTNRLTFQSINRTDSPFMTAMEETGGGGSVKLGVGILAGVTSGDQLIATLSFTASGAGTASVAFDGDSGIARYPDAADILDTTTGASYIIS